MDEQDYLVKAQEADAFIKAAHSQGERERWEEIAAEYRQLAETVRMMRRGQDPSVLQP